MNLEQLPGRILHLTYDRAVELGLDEEFIDLIEEELNRREGEKTIRIE
ncbi:sporulation histidine kinase inhibitor Sda [Halobacillus shinanisalinarum]|uniref:Sporulation histidine kinase inhibitor Sda n=1 Tax=Halobacillus shinanisalinarum TaxID=2932258 RepID=A0ABY4H5N6_9BACI|nr:sporulation histidine kinase inhibitor Sda [Halobacillus shinanisalinarum]UOQ95240.1 sporulation histidine kinase inhibitor Sda [Halobacillus shinanisalinarum]